MKWITDKAPDNNNLVHIEYSTGKTDFKTTGFFERGRWYRQDGTELGWHPNIKWLDESLPGSAGIREALESVLNEYVWAVKDSLKKIGNTDEEAAKLVEVLPSVIAARQALSSTGGEKCEEPKIDDYCIWVRDRIKDLEKIEGEVVRVREVHTGAISLKFEGGHSYYISINKGTTVTID